MYPGPSLIRLPPVKLAWYAFDAANKNDLNLKPPPRAHGRHGQWAAGAERQTGGGGKKKAPTQSVFKTHYLAKQVQTDPVKVLAGCSRLEEYHLHRETFVVPANVKSKVLRKLRLSLKEVCAPDPKRYRSAHHKNERFQSFPLLVLCSLACGLPACLLVCFNSSPLDLFSCIWLDSCC